MSTSRPNILVIITDQQREDTIAALGNPTIKTPVLDRLVREGTSFRRTYTPCPVCGPTRCSISTGLPPHEAGCSDNCGHAPVDVPDFATMLRDAGYQTFGYGKGYGRFKMDRTNDDTYRGFQEWLDWDDYKQWFDEQGFEHLSGSRGRSNEYYYIPREMGCPEQYSRNHWVADHCVRAIENRDQSKPLLLCMHLGEPHPPWSVPYPWNYLYRPNELPHPLRPANYKDYQWRGNRFQNRYKWMEDAVEGDDTLLRIIKAAYYGTVSYTDQQIGRVIDALGDALDNTLVLFTTDHGEMLGDYGCVGKRCMLEAANRVPMIARLPGTFDAGKQVHGATTTIDIMPTILQAAGLDAPELSEARPLQEMTDLQPGERIVFSQFSRGWNGLYFAGDGERVYVHSTPDRRDWNFQVRDALDQGPILPHDQRGEQLKQALLQRHKDDWYSQAVEDGDWKEHTPEPEWIMTDPDYGFLFAEPAEDIQADIDALGEGYARKCTRVGRGHPMAEHMVPLTREEREEWIRRGGLKGENAVK
jgi:choline-sulfatase